MFKLYMHCVSCELSGLCDHALQTIFRAVVVAKLMYGSSAWLRNTTVTDSQQLKAFIRQSTIVPHDFRVSMSCRLLEQLLPPALPPSYDSWQIPNRCSYLTDCNFLIIMLYAVSYWFWHCCILSFYAALRLHCSCMFFLYIAVCQFSLAAEIKRWVSSISMTANSIYFQAYYITVVEDRPIISVKYCLPVPVFHFWPKL